MAALGCGTFHYCLDRAPHLRNQHNTVFVKALAQTTMIRAALIVAIAVLVASPAAAQQTTCLPIDKLTLILRDKYRETPVLTARIDSGNMLVISASHEGSWTAAIVTPSGVGCVVSTGAALKFTPP